MKKVLDARNVEIRWLTKGASSLLGIWLRNANVLRLKRELTLSYSFCYGLVPRSLYQSCHSLPLSCKATNLPSVWHLRYV